MTVPVRREKKQEKSLSDIFNEFAKDSVERFPTLKGRLLIHDTNEQASYGRDALDLNKAGYTPAIVDAFVKERATEKNVHTYADWENKLNLCFILYNETIDIKEHLKVSEKTEKDILFILDHELAHLAIKDPPLEGENNQYKNSIKEAIADAYAMIRHYQRYGTKSEHQNSIIDPWARAGALTFNKDTLHFSTFMLDEIIKRKNIIDFASLNSQQTAELARRFAVEYTPPSSVVNRAIKKLKPVQDAYTPSSDEWLKVLAAITLDPKNDYYTFKLCRKILGGYLDGRTDMDGRSIKTTGAYWNDVRKSLKEAEIKFAAEDILFNIPLIKDKKPSRPANQNKPKP